jgi:hypothetical protein
MYGSERKCICHAKFSVLKCLSLCLMVWSLGLIAPESILAEEDGSEGTFSLEVKNKLIYLHSENASFLKILNELEKKAGIRSIVLPGVIDKQVTIDLKDLPVYAIDTLFKQLSLQNYAVLYEKIRY